MSLIKISDCVLRNLRCQCGQYLSKAPVNIQNGKSVCSDCIDVQGPTNTAVGQNSHYEALANLFAFPCRYKLDGCPKYVQFNKLENHEMECSYRIYDCPINLHSSCKCNWRGTASQLYRHYETQHPELYLPTNSPKFKIHFNDDYEVHHLIEVDDNLFLLQAKCSLESGKIWFSMVCFRQADSAALIKYTINLSSGNDNGRALKLENANPLPITKMQMTPSLCLDENIENLKGLFKCPEFIECQWNIIVSEELKLKLKSQRILEEQELYEARNEEIKCANCGFYMVPPIYRCNNGHKTCVDCKGYYNECKTCQSILVEFTEANDLQELAKSERHYCRWIKCRKMLCHNEVRQHEQNCPHRIYKCPKCNIWSGILQQLVQHFKLVHHKVDLLMTSLIDFSSRVGISTYAIAYNEIFKIDIDFHSGMLGYANLIINVWFLGSPNFVDCWNYQIENNLISVNINFPKQIMNHYSGTVPIVGHQENKYIWKPQPCITRSACLFGSTETPPDSNGSLARENQTNVKPGFTFGIPQNNAQSLFGLPITQPTLNSNKSLNKENETIIKAPIGTTQTNSASSLFGLSTPLPTSNSDASLNKENQTIAKPAVPFGTSQNNTPSPFFNSPMPQPTSDPNKSLNKKGQTFVKAESPFGTFQTNSTSLFDLPTVLSTSNSDTSLNKENQTIAKPAVPFGTSQNNTPSPFFNSLMPQPTSDSNKSLNKKGQTIVKTESPFGTPQTNSTSSLFGLPTPLPTSNSDTSLNKENQTNAKPAVPFGTSQNNPPSSSIFDSLMLQPTSDSSRSLDKNSQTTAKSKTDFGAFHANLFSLPTTVKPTVPFNTSQNNYSELPYFGCYTPQATPLRLQLRICKKSP